MANHQFTWTLGKLTFNLVRGDLFALPVEAIVNSEQTDFVLARGGSSVSGQIFRRWRDAVQKQLDAHTKGAILPLGTVLETPADPFRYIFHLGFHHPEVWLDSTSHDSDQTEHLRVIRRGTRQVLERATQLQLASVAFPLIGTGIFGLDPVVLTNEFFDEVIQFATETHLSRELAVWLAIYDSSLFDSVLQAGVQSWMNRVAVPHDWQYLRLGVSHLDLYERRVARASDALGRAFLLTQYTELVLSYFHAVLARLATPPTRPTTLLEADKPISFGLLRSEATRLAKLLHGGCGSIWGQFIAGRLVSHGERLERINQDRNNIAHKRAFRPFPEILDDLRTFLSLDQWRANLSSVALPELGNLSPWIHIQESGADQPDEAKCVGLLERWNSRAYSYVNPTTGALFKVPTAG